MQAQRRTDGAMATYLVEGYWPDPGTETFSAAAARLDDRFAQLRGEGVAIRAVAATLVPGDQAAYWLVAAPSPEAVALACAQAGLRVDRIVGAVEVRAGMDSKPYRARRNEP
jgi:hypothetical protein